MSTHTHTHTRERERITKSEFSALGTQLHSSTQKHILQDIPGSHKIRMKYSFRELNENNKTLGQQCYKSSKVLMAVHQYRQYTSRDFLDKMPGGGRIEDFCTLGGGGASQYTNIGSTPISAVHQHWQCTSIHVHTKYNDHLELVYVASIARYIRTKPMM